MQLQFEITLELIVLGGIACLLLELLRGLLLDIERYPRIKAVWRYLPYLVGGALIWCFPSAVPHTKSTLLLLAHGAASPLLFVLAHPKIKAYLESKAIEAEPKETPKEGP